VGGVRTDQERLTLSSRLMQAGMLAVVLGALVTGNHTWLPAAVISLLVTEIPAILKRNLKLVLPVELNFFIVLALFLHVIGGVYGFYDYISWWDHLTHAMSSSLVAALGFVIVVSIDWYVDSIYLPRPFVAFFVIMFTMSVGVLWELMEWLLDELTGSFLQYSLEDSMLDMLFDAFAGFVVAIATTHYVGKRTTREQFVKSFQMGQAKDKIKRIIVNRKKRKGNSS